MKLKPVDSEMLRFVGYVDTKEVPASEYERLMSAEAIGQYMHRYIINRYACDRVD